MLGLWYATSYNLSLRVHGRLFGGRPSLRRRSPPRSDASHVAVTSAPTTQQKQTNKRTNRQTDRDRQTDKETQTNMCVCDIVQAFVHACVCACIRARLRAHTLRSAVGYRQSVKSLLRGVDGQGPNISMAWKMVDTCTHRHYHSFCHRIGFGNAISPYLVLPPCPHSMYDVCR